jgi:hypothetical protein
MRRELSWVILALESKLLVAYLIHSARGLQPPADAQYESSFNALSLAERADRIVD